MSVTKLLEALDTHAEAGSDTYQYIPNVLLARSAQALAGGLLATAQAIGKGANDVGPKLDRLNNELGETKAKIKTAGKVASDVVETSAQEITTALHGLTGALNQASSGFRAASEQSGHLAARLNRLTAALVLVGVLTAGASVYYRHETKRLVDLTAQQLQHASHDSGGTTNRSTAAPKNP